MVSRCDWCVRRNECRVARAAREQHTQAVLSCAAASAGVTLRRWHLLATDMLIAPMRLAHSRGSLVRARTQAETRLVLLDAKCWRAKCKISVATFAARGFDRTFE